jgi:hypothetical protein
MLVMILMIMIVNHGSCDGDGDDQFW